MLVSCKFLLIECRLVSVDTSLIHRDKRAVPLPQRGRSYTEALRLSYTRKHIDEYSFFIQRKARHGRPSPLGKGDRPLIAVDEV